MKSQTEQNKPKTNPAFAPAHLAGGGFSEAPYRAMPLAGVPREGGAAPAAPLPAARALCAGVALPGLGAEEGHFAAVHKTSGDGSAGSVRSHCRRVPNSFGSLLLYSAK